MTIDLLRHRLMLDAEDNGSMEVIDVAQGTLLQSVPGMHSPNGSPTMSRRVKSMLPMAMAM
jgi:hypothetical protein